MKRHPSLLPVLLNRRGGGKTEWNQDLRKAIETALEPVAEKLK